MPVYIQWPMRGVKLDTSGLEGGGCAACVGCALMVLQPGKCSFWIVLKTVNGAVEREHIRVVDKAIFGHQKYKL